MAKKKAAPRRGKVKNRRTTVKTRAPKARRTARPAARRGSRKPTPKRPLKRATRPAPKRTTQAKRPVSRAPKPTTRLRQGSGKVRRSVGGAQAVGPTKGTGEVRRNAGGTQAPKLERVRRRLPDVERAGEERRDPRMLAAARSGHDDLVAKLARHTESSPKLTAGDVDAKWEDAYAIGDEAPGGDNPTPDQDRVDEIGAALGINYEDGEELQGGDEIGERDDKRWELDPASSDDWPHDKKDE